MKLLRKLTVILLALFMQGPAMVLQEVAWVNMLVIYSQERGLKRGVIETFDGKHPCEMCEMADKIRQQSNDSDEPATPRKTRSDIAWSSMMISAGRLQTPGPKCREMPTVPTEWLLSCNNRAADGPEPPPPKWC